MNKLFIGLDIGTDSVGWAATDEEYKLKRLKGKTAWGARLFSEASDAKSRRQFRSSGRRLARRKERIRLLNTLFDPLIKEMDPTFFLRLENSMLQNDDENKPIEARTECPLFINKQEEKEYYKKYPTIWHLRNALIDDEDDAFSDIRLLYLAIHHIIKYRGNFIKSGNGDNIDFEKNEYLSKFNDCLKELFDSQEENGDSIEEDAFLGLPIESFDAFMEIAENKSLGKSEKKKKLFSLMKTNDESKALIEMFCTLSSGGEFSTKKLNDKFEETYGDEKISFSSSYDENEPKYRDAIGDAFGLVEIAKAIYDHCDLKDILNNNKHLSKAFVEIYDAHKKELAILKKICKCVDNSHGLTGNQSIYVKLFNDENNAKNYPAFTHNKTTQSRCDIHTFDKYVMELLSPYNEEIELSEYKPYWTQIKELANQDRLLQTIALRSTSVIPNQLHKAELKIILDNAVKRNIPGINNIKDKLLALFKYRIPYYCGPLTDKSEYSKVVFKSDKHERILPWNYTDLIDWDATKKKFIEGLTNKCTYLKKENVLPRSSILYQDFDAWNKLNNLRINDAKPSLDELKDIFNFASLRKKTTVGDIKKYLASKGAAKEQDIAISGINPEDYLVCTSRAALSRSGCFNVTDRYSPDFKIYEEAIFLKTIYCDSQKDADDAIRKKFPTLNEEQFKALSKLSCKDWSPLSEKFLTLRKIDENGVVICNSVIDALENGEGNFMQVYAKYNYQEEVDKINGEAFESYSKKQLVKEYIEDMPPKMRRPVIQAVRIVEEISKVAKQEPDAIAIEVTRENNDPEKKKKLAKKALERKKRIEQFLKALTKESSEKGRAEELEKELEIRQLSALQGKHLYLYFLQNGKDVYSGKPIDINDVLNGTKYDTDHIIPQSLMKDDSIDNLVLVARETNQHRSNEFPLPVEIRENKDNRVLWRKLKKAGMMSDKKYNNLIRATPLTEEEIASFVAAQINVVNQSNIVVRDVLTTLYPSARLIFSKAQYPSQIRKELNIPKLRDLNDTHHAVDAYLNIVAGVELTKRYGDIRVIKAIEADEEAKKKMSYNMERFISNLIIRKDGTPTDFGKRIDATSRKHDFLLTYRFDYQDDAFYKQTIYKKGMSDTLIPIHDNLDPTKYGGYSNMTTEVNCIATVINKKGLKRVLVAIPHIIIEKSKKGIDVKDDLIALVPHKANETVTVDLKDSLPLAVTAKKNGFRYLIYSSNTTTVNLRPFSPIFLSREAERYVYQLSKCIEKNSEAFSTERNKKRVVTDRKGQNEIIFTSNDSVKVAMELFELSKQSRFDYCPMICNLRSLDFQENKIKALLSTPFTEQLKTLRALIGVFTRRPEALSGTNFRKARASVLQDDLILCSDSITGLYSKERKL